VDVVRKGNSVIKRISLLMVAALMAAMMMVATAAPAFAAVKCPDGSDATNVKGDKQCETVDPGGPGKSDNGKDFTEDTTLSQKGSFNSSHPKKEETTCTKPGGGSSDGSCPDDQVSNP
jgi:hypothetical protein